MKGLGDGDKVIEIGLIAGDGKKESFTHLWWKYRLFLKKAQSWTKLSSYLLLIKFDPKISLISFTAVFIFSHD